MKAEELRIGNYVDKGIVHWIGYSKGIQSCGILEHEFESTPKTIKLSELEPVPLTAERLLEFGFKAVSCVKYELGKFKVDSVEEKSDGYVSFTLLKV